MEWFCRSVWLLVCRWKVVISQCLVLMWELSRLQNQLVNYVLWSVMIYLVMRYLQITCSRNIHANSGELISFQQGRLITV